MRHLLQPFVLTVTAILAAGYAYVAWRLGFGVWDRVALVVPFFMVWLVPVVYWVRDRDKAGPLSNLAHIASYLCMAWLSFLVVATLARDALLLATLSLPALSSAVSASGVPYVYAGSVAALVLGALTALRGPRVRRVDIPVPDLHPDLHGFSIAQVSDLHVGLTIRKAYVERVVELSNALEPDIVVLTGDIVDGSVANLAPHVAPLAKLPRSRTYFILGNHDCYSGAARWMKHFESLGIRVLVNSSATIRKGGAKLLLGGVADPAARMIGIAPRADKAAEGDRGADFRVLLAHNPKLARDGAEAGFDLQLSGHTHAGQFFPWTLAVKLVHAPHVAGLSREGRMWVYVSAGTGTWGPPVRFGTRPELTLVRLVREG